MGWIYYILRFSGEKKRFGLYRILFYNNVEVKQQREGIVDEHMPLSRHLFDLKTGQDL